MEKNEVLLKLGLPAGPTFTVLQSTYMAIGYFEFVPSEALWTVIPLIWSIFCIIYFITK